MKKILLATAAAGFMALGIGVPAASAGVTPSPVPTQIPVDPSPCQFDSHGPSVNPQFGRDCSTPQPVPTVRSCDRIRFIEPQDGQFGRPAPEATAELSAKYFRHGEPTPQPTINPLVRCRPEQFNVAQVWVGPRLLTVIANYAQAFGPVNGVGSDTQISNTLDRLNLNTGRVNLRHTGIASPIVNTGNCTASLLQFGTWRFNGGTGLNLRAIGNGTYRLALLAHFPNIRGVCSLSFLSGNPLLQNRVSPDFLSVAVHGNGVASR